MYRILQKQLLEKTNKVVVLLGPRQIGKTTILKNSFHEACYINLEKADYIDIFNTRDLEKIQNLVSFLPNGENKIWILDEVQRLDNPGLVAKVIFDELKDIQLIISGSSALEINHKTSESLAGRKKTLYLYPLSIAEKLVQTGVFKELNLAKWDQKLLETTTVSNSDKTQNLFSQQQIKETMLWLS
jgi:predicted AAA+ superfamily ATPase